MTNEEQQLDLFEAQMLWLVAEAARWRLLESIGDPRAPSLGRELAGRAEQLRRKFNRWHPSLWDSQ